MRRKAGGAALSRPTVWVLRLGQLLPRPWGRRGVEGMISRSRGCPSLSRAVRLLILSCVQQAILCSHRLDLRRHRLESLCHPLTAIQYQIETSAKVSNSILPNQYVA
jgi:hypothetical protein